MRWLGLDYGKKKVGLALTDESGRFPAPFAIWPNGADLAARVARLARERGVGAVVIGRSVDYRGEDNPIAAAAEVFARDLRASGLEVHWESEWLTTSEAARSPAGERERGVIDDRAAAIILRSFLDRQERHDPFPPARHGAWREWMIRQTGGRRGLAWLGVIAFAEAWFFPIPPDVALLPMAYREPRRWWRLALVTTLGSLVGGWFSYLVGWWAFDWLGAPLVALYGWESQMQVAAGWLTSNAFIATLVASFTPIPDKIFNLAAGLFQINFGVFSLAYALGRGARFFLVAAAGRWLGPVLAPWLIRRFNFLALGLGVLILLWIMFH